MISRQLLIFVLRVAGHFFCFLWETPIGLHHNRNRRKEFRHSRGNKLSLGREKRLTHTYECVARHFKHFFFNTRAKDGNFSIEPTWARQIWAYSKECRPLSNDVFRLALGLRPIKFWAYKFIQRSRYFRLERELQPLDASSRHQTLTAKPLKILHLNSTRLLLSIFSEVSKASEQRVRKHF